MPTNVAVTSLDREVLIGWDPVNEADSYRIEYETDPDQLIVDAGAMAFTHGAAAPLAGNSLYVYTVTRSDQTTVVVSAMPIQDDVSIPLGVSLTPGPRDNRLSWNPVPDAIAYRIYWSFDTGVTPSNGTLIDAISGTTYTHEGLDPGAEYHYVVTAISSEEVESSASAEVGGQPGGPATVTVTAGNRRVTLSWTDAIEPSIPYIVSRMALVTLVDIPYLISPLNNDQRYGFRIVPHFLSGNGRSSTRVYATPAATVSGVPRGVTLTAGQGYNTLAWVPVTGTHHYDVAWRTLDAQPSSSGVFSNLSDTTYRHTGLDPCTTPDIPCPTYAYVVSAVSNSGDAKTSSEVAAVSIQLQPFPPLITNLPIVRLTGLKPSLSRITLNGTEIVGPTRETWFEYPAPLSEGFNSLRFVAIDEQANSSADGVYQITLDTTPPSPPTAQCGSPSATPPKTTLTGTKDPQTTILQLDADNVEQLVVGNDAKSTWTATLDVTAGVTLFAKDIAGNASATITLTCP